MPKSKKTAKKSGNKAEAGAPKSRKKKVALAPVKMVGLIIAPPFLRSSWRELKLVTWPNWKLSRQLTIAVIIFALVFAVLVGLVDWGFNAAFKELFLR